MTDSHIGHFLNDKGLKLDSALGAGSISPPQLPHLEPNVMEIQHSAPGLNNSISRTTSVTKRTSRSSRKARNHTQTDD